MVKKLLVETPSAQLVDGYLVEISKAYGVKWSPSISQPAVEEEAGQLVGMVSSVAVLLTSLLQGQTQTPESLPSYSEEEPSAAKLPDLPPTEEEEEKATGASKSDTMPAKENPEDDFASLARRFQELKKR